MKVIAVSVGVPAPLNTARGQVLSSITKQPVIERVRVSFSGLTGDQQADRSVHGGANKAICLMPSEHYPRWSEFLNGASLPTAFFGENLTAAGVDRKSVV